MLDLVRLRETVDLPASYCAEIPEAERKRLLHGSLLEYRLRNKFLGLKSADKPAGKVTYSGSGRDYTRSTYNTNTAKIARYLTKVTRANAREIEAATGLSLNKISPTMVFMRNDNLIINNGKRRFNGGRLALAFSITEAGRIYGEKL